MNYRVISADCHVNEPPSLWQDRLSDRFKEMGPKMARCEDGGDGWSFEGLPPSYSFGLNALAGRPFEGYRSSGLKFEEILPGNYDGSAHIEDQLKDGVDASVLFPGAAMSSYTMSDRELGVACMLAYNDWLTEEFCAVNPARLIGLPLLPVEDGMGSTLTELDRCVSRGTTGFFLPGTPQVPFHDAMYDPLWDAAQEADVALCFHRNHGGKRTQIDSGDTYVAGIVHRFFSAIQPLSNMIYTGLFDRFPRLKIVTAETNFGWMPFWIETMEDQFDRQRHWAKLSLRRRPKDYVWQNIYATFLEDHAGFSMIDRVPIDNIMFSSDYPHSTTLWPNSQNYIEAQTKGLATDIKEKVLSVNAGRLFKLN